MWSVPERVYNVCVTGQSGDRSCSAQWSVSTTDARVRSTRTAPWHEPVFTIKRAGRTCQPARRFTESFDLSYLRFVLRIKPGTHWRQVEFDTVKFVVESRLLPKPATIRQQSWLLLYMFNFVADTFHFGADTFHFVASFGNKSATTCIWQFVTVDFVADTFNFVADTFNFVADTVNFVADTFNFVADTFNSVADTFNFVADTVNFVARVLNVLSTLLPVCISQSNMVDFVDFQRSRPSWIQLCHQCVPGFRWTTSCKWLSTVGPLIMYVLPSYPSVRFWLILWTRNSSLKWPI